VSPIKTTLRTGQRFYEWQGQRCWSVTTIIGGGLPKPALINWAKKFTAEYAIDNYARLGTLLEPSPDGFVDRAGALDWLKNASFRDRDRKADIGTAVHEATEAHVLGKPTPPWPDEIKPRMAMFERFLADWDPSYEEGMTEASCFNLAESYAGTLDAIVTIHGRKYLMDVKTGGKDIYPDVALQLAAYRAAEFIAAPDGSAVPMPEVDGCLALHLPETGDYTLIEVRADEEVLTAFKFVREVFRWQEATSKSVLLGSFPSTLESASVDDAVEAIGQLGIATVARGQTDLPPNY
jgi:hypothetical protein